MKAQVSNILPYGNDETRKSMIVLLSELESHVWKNGDILDKGKHNDIVMALAHAVDMFNMSTKGGMPAVSANVDMSSWGRNKKKNNSNRVSRKSGKSGKYRTFF